MAKSFTIQEIADSNEISSRLIRKVLRANIAKDNQPGRGARWAINEKDVPKLLQMVDAYTARANVIADLGDD